MRNYSMEYIEILQITLQDYNGILRSYEIYNWE